MEIMRKKKCFFFKKTLSAPVWRMDVVECTDAWCAKFALPKFANAKWANFASFCVKVYGKSFVDFYWQ